MKIEAQVCSLELAKRLKELGVKQESLFVYEYFNDTCYATKFIPFALAKPLPDGCKQYSAFTVAELGEMLPDYIYSKTTTGADKPLFFNKVDDIYSAGILNENKSIIPRFIDKNEANARAKMLIYLIENGLMPK